LYQSEEQEWPMDMNHQLERQPSNFIGTDIYPPPEEMNDFVEQLYVNSDGFALLLDRDAPLFVRRTTNKDVDSMLCFSVSGSGADKPYLQTTIEGYLDLKLI